MTFWPRFHKFVLTCAIVSVGLVGIQTASAASNTVPASFDISGSGFGHGVGLSQYGSRGMAQDGFSASAIIKHYYVGTTIGTEANITRIRVGLAQDKQFVALRGEALGGQGGRITVTIDSTSNTVGPGSLVLFSIVDSQLQASFLDGTKIRGSIAQITWNGTNANGSAPSVVNLSTGSTAALAKSGLGADCKDYFSGTVPSGFDACPHRYRYGTMEIAAGKFGDQGVDLNVVNTLRLGDEYLYGLGEVPSSWESAALQAQVIAARSYALATYNDIVNSVSAIKFAGTKVRAACLCQIYSTIVDQNFVGFNKEYSSQGSRWTAAVDATIPTPDSPLGSIVTYKGKVIKAFFASSTGGSSQPISQVWGAESYPWSQVVNDRWSLLVSTGNPNISWTQTILQGTLLRNLNAIGIPITSVKTFTIAEVYPSGGVSKLKATSANGKVFNISVGPRGDITPDTLRWVLGVRATYLTKIKASKSNIPAPTPTGTPTVSPTPTPTPTPSVSPTISPTPTMTPTVSPTPSPSVTLPTAPLKSITNITIPAKNVFSQVFAISGDTTPLQSNIPITVQERINDNWFTVGYTKTQASGNWSVNLKFRSLGPHSLRVVASNSLGQVVSAHSTTSTVGSITTVVPTQAVRNSNITVSGIVQPARPGVAVKISRKLPGKPWQSLCAATTNTDGKWSVSCPVGLATGKVRFHGVVNDAVLGFFYASDAIITVQ